MFIASISVSYSLWLILKYLLRDIEASDGARGWFSLYFLILVIDTNNYLATNIINSKIDKTCLF